MKFKEYKFEELKIVKRSKWFEILTDFQNSGLKCAILEDWKHKSAENCQNAIIDACKRYRIPHIKSVVRHGEVFLVNNAISEGQE